MGRIIGILGGGQLAQMLCESGEKSGHKTIVLDPSGDACGGKVADEFYREKYTEREILKKIAERASVITYEFENIPRETVEIIENFGGRVPQSYRPLYLSQHRIREKKAVEKLNIPLGKYQGVRTYLDLQRAIESVGYPGILKSATGGYDGKGQWVIENEEDFRALDFQEGEYIYEEKIDLEREVSILVGRSLNGQMVMFPVAENIHRDGILRKTIVPAHISKDEERELKNYGLKIMEGLNFYGILCMEFFIGKDGRILFNEMAPRPHNSHHYTLDSCQYSQFDLLIKAILGEELEEPKLYFPVIMLNILGEDRKKIENKNFPENWKIKLYGKTPWKPGRKMGHINIIGETLEEIEEEINKFWREDE